MQGCLEIIVDRVWESDKVKILRNSYLFKASKSFLIMSTVALLIAGIAALLFVGAPFLQLLAYGALAVAKWTAIMGGAALILSLLLLGFKWIYAQISAKINQIVTPAAGQ